jgi:hypothetical protein
MKKFFPVFLVVVLVLLLVFTGVVLAQDECNPNGTICIGTITLSDGVGNPEGGIELSSPCPSLSSLTGIDVKTNVYVRQARSSCNGLLFDSSFGNVLPTGSINNGDWIVNTPPGGLTDQQSICPPGMVVVGYNSRSGALVDGIQVICQSLDGYLPAGGLFYGAPVGGGGGSENPSIFCPAGQVAVGITGRAGDGLDYFRLQCAQLSGIPILKRYLPLLTK